MTTPCFGNGRRGPFEPNLRGELQPPMVLAPPVALLTLRPSQRAYWPVNFGGRFSMKAVKASIRSWEGTISALTAAT